MKKTMIAVLCLILVASTLTGCRRGSGTTTVPTTEMIPSTSGATTPTTRATTAPTEEATRDTTGATEDRDTTDTTGTHGTTGDTTGTESTDGSARTRSGNARHIEGTTSPTRGPATRSTLPGALG